MKNRQIRIEFKNGDKLLKTVNAKLRVTPFNMLPTEKDGSNSDEVEEQKKFIRKYILKSSNEQVMKNPRTRELLTRLGADVTIHTFACNFEVDGKINEDIVSYVISGTLSNTTDLATTRTKQTISILGSTNGCHCQQFLKIRTPRRSPCSSLPPK